MKFRVNQNQIIFTVGLAVLTGVATPEWWSFLIGLGFGGLCIAIGWALD